MTDQELELLLERAAEKGARRGVAEFCKMLGIDLDDVKEVNKLRNDLIFLRDLNSMKKRGGVVAFTVAATAVTVFLLQGVWEWFKVVIKAVKI